MNQLKIDFLWNHPVYKEYGCDENGNVYSFKLGKIKKMKPCYNKKGYLTFGIWVDGKKGFLVNRFVWECIKGQIPEGYDVDHRNFVRDDNRIENLRAIPASDNRTRVSEEGRKGRGKKSAYNGRKSSSKQVIQLDLDGNFIAEYPSVREAERQTGIDHSNILKCCNEKKWVKSAGGFIWKYKEVA